MDTILTRHTPKTALSLSDLGGAIFLALAHLICGVVLTIDVSSEIYAALTGRSSDNEHGPVLLVAELIATALLYFIFVQSMRQILFYRDALQRAKLRLEGVRNEFSGLVGQRFQEWDLSPAETEVALLTIKGLRISDIAQVRDCREGTIKSHLTSIYKKSGTSSRPDLLARFVDDFLELANDRLH
ncbi:DNA-binding transcriptional regulator, CsgD family [Thalassovita litoralis]|uniref:DNA-binding transcriptional regulator, CsgD family n=1 Tax=Thalassovita litoralis TaxID=1010611 RepID=A0A521FNG4_9RHOB|nr:helix-turn-helix transcriptional regulator [Thalassovita litoralis]SMO97666.1 DNA-binding transcriptional regulator, CsgD family [Thalassovita litoralis]